MYIFIYFSYKFQVYLLMHLYSSAFFTNFDCINFLLRHVTKTTAVRSTALHYILGR